jgi:hypothetical protein
MIAGCPDDRRLQGFLEGSLEPGPLAEVEAHLDACERCQGRLDANPDGFRSVEVPEIPGLTMIRRIGSGGMGTVWLARQHQPDRLVAVKTLPPLDASRRKQLSERFRREAAILASLDHPGVMTIHAFDERDGVPWFSMPYFPLGSLADRIADFKVAPGAGRASVEKAVRLVHAIARAMEHAATRQVIHRDLKPANVLLDELGQPRVSDFGLAKRLEGDSDATQASVIAGTWPYMAPEQAMPTEDGLSTACDVYALGAILHELLTGFPPFCSEKKRSPSLDELLHQPVTRLRPTTRAVDRELEAITLKCLEKDPQRRYHHTGELADELSRWHDGRPVKVRPIGSFARALRGLRRRPALAGLIGLVTLLVVGATTGGVWYYYAHLRTTIEHYEFLVERHGRPEGVTPVTSEVARRRQRTLRFTRRGGRVIRVESVNGLGTLTPDTALESQFFSGDARSPEAARVDFEFGPGGEPLRRVAHDEFGTFLWSFQHAGERLGHYADARGLLRANPQTGATHVEWTLSPEGFHREVRFIDAFGRPKPGDQGIFGIRSEFDESGLPLRVRYLGPRGETWISSTTGVAGFRARRDPLGRILRLECLGPDGESPCFTRLYGYSSWTQTYDKWGNPIEMRRFDSAGRAIMSGTSRGHRTLAEFSEHGLLIREREFNAAGEPVVGNAPCHEVRIAHDARGGAVATEYFDAAGGRALNANGVHRLEYEHDERGRVIQTLFLGTDGRPCVDANGISRFKLRLDSNGRRIEYRYFDTENRPALHRQGNHIARYEYNDAGQKTRATYFDPDGRPIALSTGFHAEQTTYDEFGSISEVAYFDEFGRATASTFGYHRLFNEWDEHARLRKESCFGPDGRPALFSSGMHAIEYVRESGLPVIIKHLGVDGAPTSNLNGIGSVRSRFDALGRTIEASYFGADGKPVMGQGLHHRAVTSFDERGRVAEIRHLDLEGRPRRLPGRPALLRYRYDDADRRISTAWFDGDHQPAAGPDGWHRSQTEFDERGRESSLRVFAVPGGSEISRQGWHRRATVYLDGTTETSYFDRDDRPLMPSGFHRQRTRLDPLGRETRREHFDSSGKPCLGPGGAERVDQRFNHRSELIAISFHRADGTPFATDQGGYHRVEFRHDARGQVVEQRYFDIAGARMLTRTGGFHLVRIDVDDRGGELARSYFGTGDEPVIGRGGYHRMVNTHNDRGDLVRTAYLDLRGAETRGPDLFASVTKTYDRERRLVSILNDGYDPNATGCVRRVDTFDGMKRKIREEWFDAEGKPARHRQWNCVRTDFAWNDADGSGIRRATGCDPVDGYDIIEDRYDALERKISYRYLRADGTPALNRREGCHRGRYLFANLHTKVASDVSLEDEFERPLPISVTVNSVTPGGPAEREGMRPRDVILRVAGETFPNHLRFGAALETAKLRNAPIRLDIRRDGQELTIMLPCVPALGFGFTSRGPASIEIAPAKGSEAGLKPVGKSPR